MAWLLLAAFLLAGLGVWMLLRSGSLRRRTGLPSGRVVYADTGAWDRCDRPLFSNEHRLVGQPDYLVRVRRTKGRGFLRRSVKPDDSREWIVPVEVKSGAAPAEPYTSHLLQLATYCLLVEEKERQPVPYGIVKYDDRAFEVDFTPALRAELLRTLEAMRTGLRGHAVGRSHDQPARCRGCGYRDRCDQRLA